MTAINITPTTIPNWQHGGLTAEMRIFATDTFVTNDGKTVNAGTSGDNYQLIPCTVVGNDLVVPAVLINSTTDSTVPGVRYIADLYDSETQFAHRYFEEFRVPISLGVSVSWDQLRIFNGSSPAVVPAGHYTAVQTDAAISAAINAIVPNDEHLNGYASLAIAVASIGAATATLTVREALSQGANLTIPRNITLNFLGAGKITLSSGVTLTVGSMNDPGNRLVFAGTGSLRFMRGAVKEMNLAWYAGNDPAGTLTATVDHAMTQFLANVAVNGGGKIHIPQGAWPTNGNHILPRGTSIEGEAANIIAGGSELVLQSANRPLLHIQDTQGHNQFKHLRLIGNGQANSDLLLVKTTNPVSSSVFRISCEDVVFTSSTYGFRVDRNGATFQAGHVEFTNCFFEGHSFAAIRSNTVNTNYNFSNTGMIVGPGAWAVYLEEGASCTFRGLESAGTVVFPLPQQVERQTITGSVTTNGNARSLVTKAGMIGSPITVVVPVDTSMNTPSLIAEAFKTALANDPTVAAYCHVWGAGADVNLVLLDAEANDTSFNFTIENVTSTGIGTSLVSVTDTVGQVPTNDPAGNIFISGGDHPPITFIGCQDEGFTKSVVCNTGFSDITIINFEGCLLQGSVELSPNISRVNSRGSVWTSKAFRDHGNAILYSFGDVIQQRAEFPGLIRELHNFTGIRGVGVAAIEHRVKYDSPTDFRSYIGLSTRAAQVHDFPPKAWFEVLSRHGIEGTFRIGECNRKGIPTFWYDFWRSPTDGFLHVKGNGAVPFVGFVFHQNIEVRDALTGQNALSGQTNTAGGPLLLRGGVNTGNAVGGLIRLQTSNPDSSGSNPQPLTDRTIIGVRKVLADNVVTDLFSVDLSSAVSAGGLVHITVESTAGADVQVQSAVVRWAAVKNSGTVTTNVAVVNEGGVGPGTLINAFTMAAGTNIATFRIQSDTSLTSAVITSMYSIENNSRGAISLL